MIESVWSRALCLVLVVVAAGLHLPGHVSAHSFTPEDALLRDVVQEDIEAYLEAQTVLRNYLIHILGNLQTRVHQHPTHQSELRSIVDGLRRREVEPIKQVRDKTFLQETPGAPSVQTIAKVVLNLLGCDRTSSHKWEHLLSKVEDMESIIPPMPVLRVPDHIAQLHQKMEHPFVSYVLSATNNGQYTVTRHLVSILLSNYRIQPYSPDLYTIVQNIIDATDTRAIDFPIFTIFPEGANEKPNKILLSVLKNIMTRSKLEPHLSFQVLQIIAALKNNGNAKPFREEEDIADWLTIVTEDEYPADIVEAADEVAYAVKTREPEIDLDVLYHVTQGMNPLEKALALLSRLTLVPNDDPIASSAHALYAHVKLNYLYTHSLYFQPQTAADLGFLLNSFLTVKKGINPSFTKEIFKVFVENQMHWEELLKDFDFMKHSKPRNLLIEILKEMLKHPTRLQACELILFSFFIENNVDAACPESSKNPVPFLHKLPGKQDDAVAPVNLYPSLDDIVIMPAFPPDTTLAPSTNCPPEQLIKLVDPNCILEIIESRFHANYIVDLIKYNPIPADKYPYEKRYAVYQALLADLKDNKYTDSITDFVISQALQRLPLNYKSYWPPTYIFLCPAEVVAIEALAPSTEPTPVVEIAQVYEPLPPVPVVIAPVIPPNCPQPIDVIDQDSLLEIIDTNTHVRGIKELILEKPILVSDYGNCTTREEVFKAVLTKKRRSIDDYVLDFVIWQAVERVPISWKGELPPKVISVCPDELKYNVQLPAEAEPTRPPPPTCDPSNRVPAIDPYTLIDIMDTHFHTQFVEKLLLQEPILVSQYGQYTTREAVYKAVLEERALTLKEEFINLDVNQAIQRIPLSWRADLPPVIIDACVDQPITNPMTVVMAPTLPPPEQPVCPWGNTMIEVIEPTSLLEIIQDKDIKIIREVLLNTPLLAAKYKHLGNRAEILKVVLYDLTLDSDSEISNLILLHSSQLQTNEKGALEPVTSIKCVSQSIVDQQLSQPVRQPTPIVPVTEAGIIVVEQTTEPHLTELPPGALVTEEPVQTGPLTLETAREMGLTTEATMFAINQEWTTELQVTTTEPPAQTTLPPIPTMAPVLVVTTLPPIPAMAPEPVAPPLPIVPPVPTVAPLPVRPMEPIPTMMPVLPSVIQTTVTELPETTTIAEPICEPSETKTAVYDTESLLAAFNPLAPKAPFIYSRIKDYLVPVSTDRNYTKAEVLDDILTSLREDFFELPVLLSKIDNLRQNIDFEGVGAEFPVITWACLPSNIINNAMIETIPMSTSGPVVLAETEPPFEIEPAPEPELETVEDVCLANETATTIVDTETLFTALTPNAPKAPYVRSRIRSFIIPVEDTRTYTKADVLKDVLMSLREEIEDQRVIKNIDAMIINIMQGDDAEHLVDSIEVCLPKAIFEDEEPIAPETTAPPLLEPIPVTPPLIIHPNMPEISTIAVPEVVGPVLPMSPTIPPIENSITPGPPATIQPPAPPGAPGLPATPALPPPLEFSTLPPVLLAEPPISTTLPPPETPEPFLIEPINPEKPHIAVLPDVVPDTPAPVKQSQTEPTTIEYETTELIPDAVTILEPIVTENAVVAVDETTLPYLTTPSPVIYVPEEPVTVQQVPVPVNNEITTILLSQTELPMAPEQPIEPFTTTTELPPTTTEGMAPCPDNMQLTTVISNEDLLKLLPAAPKARYIRREIKSRVFKPDKYANLTRLEVLTEILRVIVTESNDIRIATKARLLLDNATQDDSPITLTDVCMPPDASTVPHSDEPADDDDETTFDDCTEDEPEAEADVNTANNNNNNNNNNNLSTETTPQEVWQTTGPPEPECEEKVEYIDTRLMIDACLTTPTSPTGQELIDLILNSNIPRRSYEPLNTKHDILTTILSRMKTEVVNEYENMRTLKVDTSIIEMWLDEVDKLSSKVSTTGDCAAQPDVNLRCPDIPGSEEAEALEVCSSPAEYINMATLQDVLTRSTVESSQQVIDRLLGYEVLRSDYPDLHKKSDILRAVLERMAVDIENYIAKKIVEASAMEPLIEQLNMVSENIVENGPLDGEPDVVPVCLDEATSDDLYYAEPEEETKPTFSLESQQTMVVPYEHTDTEEISLNESIAKETRKPGKKKIRKTRIIYNTNESIKVVVQATKNKSDDDRDTRNLNSTTINDSQELTNKRSHRNRQEPEASSQQELDTSDVATSEGSDANGFQPLNNSQLEDNEQDNHNNTNTNSSKKKMAGPTTHHKGAITVTGPKELAKGTYEKDNTITWDNRTDSGGSGIEIFDVVEVENADTFENQPLTVASDQTQDLQNYEADENPNKMATTIRASRHKGTKES